MKRFVAYYRVSTDRQGQSGLGLDAQRAVVADYAAQRQASVLEEFTDVLSGRSNARPELANALARARQLNAVLVVAKLDRLARNARFLAELVDGDVDVVFCNLPDLPTGAVGRFMVQIMASIAELESGMISDRTSAALQQAKARGVKLGGYRGGHFPKDVRDQGRAKRTEMANEFAQAAFTRLQQLMAQGVTARSHMAKTLNEEGYRTPSGRGHWCSTTVTRILNRLHGIEAKRIEEAKKQAAQVFTLAAAAGRRGPKAATPLVRMRA